MKKIEFGDKERMSDFGERAVLIMAALFTYIFQLASDDKAYCLRNMVDHWSSLLLEYHLPADGSSLIFFVKDT